MYVCRLRRPDFLLLPHADLDFFLRVVAPKNTNTHLLFHFRRRHWQSGVPGSGPSNGAAIMKGLMTVKVVSQLYV
jgi:cyanophycinase-like exopeptidase